MLDCDVTSFDVSYIVTQLKLKGKNKQKPDRKRPHSGDQDYIDADKIYSPAQKDISGDSERDIRYSVWIHQGSVYPYNLNVKSKTEL